MIAPSVIHGAESPSLVMAATGRRPAFELKFLIDEAAAGEIEAWARKTMRPDPHGDPALDGAYRTATLYLDTPELDVFHRSPEYRRRKYRVRRYGAAGWVFLERKTKANDRVAKRRVVVSAGEIPRLVEAEPEASWPGTWFRQRLVAKRLIPSCRVEYLRSAYVGSCPESPLRLTLDRDIHGEEAFEQWSLPPATGKRGLRVLSGKVVLELKFAHALPGPFKDLVREFRLQPTPASKYRVCRDCLGLPPDPDEVNRA